MNRLDESTEFILPIDIIIRILQDLSEEHTDRLLSARGPRLQSYAQSIKDVIRQTRSVECAKMSVYAVIVEECCRKFLVGYY